MITSSTTILLLSIADSNAALSEVSGHYQRNWCFKSFLKKSIVLKPKLGKLVLYKIKLFQQSNNKL